MSASIYNRINNFGTGKIYDYFDLTGATSIKTSYNETSTDGTKLRSATSFPKEDLYPVFTAAAKPRFFICLINLTEGNSSLINSLLLSVDPSSTMTISIILFFGFSFAFKTKGKFFLNRSIPLKFGITIDMVISFWLDCIYKILSLQNLS